MYVRMYVHMYVYIPICMYIVPIFRCMKMFTIETNKQKQTKISRTKPLINLVITFGNINMDDIESHVHRLDDFIVLNRV